MSQAARQNWANSCRASSRNAAGARPSARAIRGSLAPVTQSPSSCGGIFEDQRRLNLAGPPDHKNVDPHERYPSRINHIGGLWVYCCALLRGPKRRRIEDIQDAKISKDMLNLAKRIVAMKAGAMFTN
jgi:hypothetical protein